MGLRERVQPDWNREANLARLVLIGDNPATSFEAQSLPQCTRKSDARFRFNVVKDVKHNAFPSVFLKRLPREHCSNFLSMLEASHTEATRSNTGNNVLECSRSHGVICGISKPKLQEMCHWQLSLKEYISISARCSVAHAKSPATKRLHLVSHAMSKVWRQPAIHARGSGSVSQDSYRSARVFLLSTDSLSLFPSLSHCSGCICWASKTDW